MSKVLKAGVIGAGVFGGYHARYWAGRPDVRFIGTYDTHHDRAQRVAAPFGGRGFAAEADLLAAVDLVSICSPASAHGAGAMAALRAGVPVYIEKPLATDPEAADRIIVEAGRRGLVVACGFLERAAVQALGLFDLPAPPLRMEARRMGPPSPRNRDVSVVLDLMIHDIDLALRLAGSEPFAVEAEGRHDADGQLDAVTADIAFENGFMATLTASRASQDRERSLRLVYARGDITVDLLTGEVSNATPHRLSAATPSDPLGASLTAFAEAVRGDRAGPLANGVDGARALDLALAVERAVGG